MGYQHDSVKEIAKKIHAEGFRVFIAKSGTHGFFTDGKGSRVISFGCDLSNIRFSGCYTTNLPRQTGTGWGIVDNVERNFHEVFNAGPPSGAVGCSTWKLTTLNQYLKTYQRSSCFKLFNGAFTNKEQRI